MSMSDVEETSANESAGEALALVRCPKETWPEKGSLAALLEQEITVRRRAREKGWISRWPSVQATGVPSVKAMGCNVRILEVIAEWWCPTQATCQCIPIDLMRREIRSFRRLVDLPVDLVLTNMDADGMKKLFSHGIRRLKTGSETRVAFL